jgi:hypothetical protein
MRQFLRRLHAFCYGCACLMMLAFLFVAGPAVAIFLWNVIADSAAR